MNIFKENTVVDFRTQMVAHLTFTRREPKKETEACDFCNVTEDTAYSGGTTKLLASILHRIGPRMGTAWFKTPELKICVTIILFYFGKLSQLKFWKVYQHFLYFILTVTPPSLQVLYIGKRGSAHI